MTQPELEVFFKQFVEEQDRIMVSKGKSYAGTTAAAGDRLANFKRVGERLGLDPLTVWAVYFLKHVDSICTFVKTGYESEGFRSRALDSSNYSLLGAALVDERERDAGKA